MTGADETPTGITAVSTAQYVSDGLIFAAVQFVRCHEPGRDASVFTRHGD